jgi:hypothetical protein
VCPCVAVSNKTTAPHNHQHTATARAHTHSISHPDPRGEVSRSLDTRGIVCEDAEEDLVDHFDVPVINVIRR